jgi:hypothetical protein
MVVVGAAVVAGVLSTTAVEPDPASSPELEQPAISAVATSTWRRRDRIERLFHGRHVSLRQ